MESSRDPASEPSTAAASDTLAATLDSVLAQGSLARLPKHPERRDQLLAVLCTFLHRRYPYAEPELNQALKDALHQLGAEFDHVTTRRFLVDLGFLKRDRSGSRYYLNYQRLAATLSEAAQEAVPELLAAASRKAADQAQARAARAARYRGRET